MLPETYKSELKDRLQKVGNPREMVVDVMLEVQEFYGWFSDEALEQAAVLLGMSSLEIEELATFYNTIYRQPVGKFVIHVCDSVICWMENGYGELIDHIGKKLGIGMGETTPDGLFSLLPACCIGYCDHAPAIMINKTVYGDIAPAKMDEIIETLRQEK